MFSGKNGNYTWIRNALHIIAYLKYKKRFKTGSEVIENYRALADLSLLAGRVGGGIPECKCVIKDVKQEKEHR